MTPRSRPIGGEFEQPGNDGVHTYLVDSGRSALRLILRSGFDGRRFLLPDFICDVVPSMLDELGVRYDTYRVDANLAIDAASIAGKRYDVLYVVNYFGCRADYRAFVNDETWVVEDCVSLPFVDPPPSVGHWIGFNSLRKVTPLCDGSVVKSTIALDGTLIAPDDATFVALKARAKAVKYAHLRDGSHSEREYLDLFRRGEEELDRQAGVHAMSQRSLCALFDVMRTIESEYRIRNENFQVLDARLRRHSIGIAPDYPCFYVLSLPQRDQVRQRLFEQEIYLPSHWPNLRGWPNALYRTLLPIPVDSRYAAADMQRVADAIEACCGSQPAAAEIRS